MIFNRYVAILTFLVFAGCGSESGPNTVDASGIVFYKGEPVAEAKVAFLGDGKIRPAVAVTDDDGNFVLTTSRSGDGAVPGLHAVTVTKTVEPPSRKKASTGGSMSMEEAAAAAQAPLDEAKTLYLVPEKYSTPGTSGLSFEVKAGADNHFEIKLED